ncbi:MAG: gamma-glutamyl-gamma-aminobutyrate hydrolase family protein [Acidimicrobiia bacterium]|nr:gamma-glutamyl-gamma-aminobutyrate hydrolase family protein [Actinomycetota bacterium]MBL6924606.1 gamma-glutamyl-gamma-aminobutyrate hydrolase family protein [Acidimicrobiia bacterium]MBL6927363.1 gamma-glutamyl-gamma-aminobutyrate hydrolase family protein [Acidimicrobiia bacterium]
MANRPLIGITGRRKKGRDIVDNLEVLSDFDVDLYYADYANGVLEAGGLPVHLPVDADPVDLLDHLDGLILPGGADIDPGRYGAESETDDFPPEPTRDEQELALVNRAYELTVPILGICRGLQIINVYAGGTLHQDVAPHAGFDQPTTTEWHTVTFESGSVLGGIYGAERPVNSLHHQTINRVGDGLRVSARSPEGSIEGIEHTDLPIVAVQWHPEMLPTRPSDPLFTWLVEAATERS